MMNSEILSLGIDVGTSGIRGVCIDENRDIVATAKVVISENSREALRNPLNWKKMLAQVLDDLNPQISLNKVASICVDGQSGTVLLSDKEGALFTNQSLLYNDPPSQNATTELTKQIGICPASLGRAYDLWDSTHHPKSFFIVHQADWIAGLLCGIFNQSDENNALKMGYLPETKNWAFDPHKLSFNTQALPEITTPSTLRGFATTPFAQEFGLQKHCKIVSGTTDSTAGFIAATGLQNLKTGTAVTSLGTTLVIKTIAEQNIDSPKFGVYSHKLFDQWVTGGASNSGAGVLLNFFTTAQLKALSKQIDPTVQSTLNYYPLLVKGERFPVNDSNMESLVSPRPSDDAEFLAGLLESIARIEKKAFDVLDTLGAPYPSSIITVGGGSYNKVWTKIRERILGVKIITAKYPDAAYGSALIAQRGSNN